MKKIAIVLCFITSSIFCQTRNTANTANTVLNKGRDWEPLTLSPLNGNDHAAIFSLSTSWIPGESHKGYFRYRIAIRGNGVSLKESSTYFTKLNSCKFSLVLYDSEGFKLRTIDLVFDEGLSDSGDIVALTSNDMAQMDLADYKTLLAGGRWNISWSAVGGCSR